MPTTTLPFPINPSMERKNRRSSSSTNNDNLAVVKAAAWAWYQHGSGSEGKAMNECFDISRIRRAPKPSRYKLEAIKLAQEEAAATEEASSSSRTTTTTYNSLLDTYEIERISKQLDILIEYNRLHRQNIVSSPENEASNVILVKKKKNKNKNKKLEGFWFRHGLACGTTMADVVIKTVVLSDRRRRPEKRA